MGLEVPLGSWRGIGGPKNLPPAVAKLLSAELKKIYDTQEYKDFMIRAA